MSITDTVQSTVNVQDTAPKASSFGEPCIAASGCPFVGVQEYDAEASGLSAMVSDGFTTTSPAYRQASKLISQNPHCAKFKVASRVGYQNQMIRLTPKWATVGKPVSVDVEVGGTTTSVSYTPVAGDAVADVCDAVAAAILAIVGVVASDQTTCVELNPTNVANRVYLSNVVGFDMLDISDAGTVEGQEIHLTPADPNAEARSYEATVACGENVVHLSVSVLSGTTQNAAALAVQAALAALTDLTATVVEQAGETDYVKLVPNTDAVRVFVSNESADLTVADASTTTQTITDDLTAAQAADLDWYGLLIDSNLAADILLAAAWAEANSKLFAAQSFDSLILTSDGGVASDMYGLTYHRTACFATRHMGGFVSAGLMGRQFAQDPGSSTWAHKAVSGATPDAYSATEFNYARAAKAIVYVTDQGVNHTYDGFACSGRHLDVTRGLDWLNARIREAVLVTIVNAEKLGYTDVDAAQVKAAISGVLSAGERAKLLAPGAANTVTATPAADQSATDKAARHFAGFKWNGVLQGAIQSVAVQGTVTL